MAKPQLKKLVAGMEGWDTEHNDNVDVLQAAPTPIAELDENLDETDLAGEFDPNDYDRCLIWVNHSTLGWTLYASKSGSWLKFAGPS